MTTQVALAIILAVAAALRFAILAHNSLWFDEAFVAYAVQKGWRDLLIFLATKDNHPPLYYIVLKLWVGIAGTSEAALRTPSAVCGVLCVPLAYALMRRLSEGTAPAVIAALLVALSPFEVMAGQEARMYPLLQLLVLAATLLLILPASPRHRVLYVAAAAAMAYTNYFGFLVIGAHGLWTAWRARERLVSWTIDVGIAGLLFLPWVPIFLDQATRRHGAIWSPHPFLDVAGLFAFGGSLFGLGSYLFPGFPLSAAQVAAVAPFVALAVLGARGLALPAVSLVAPIAAMALLSLAKPAFFPRWFSFLFPFYAMLIANAVLRIAPRRAAAGALIGAIAACGLPVLARYYSDPSYRPWDWRDAAAYVRSAAKPEDLLVFVGDELASIPFAYYYGPTDGSRNLMPTEGSHRRPNVSPSQIAAMARQHPRLWVISVIGWRRPTTQRLVPLLQTAYAEAGVRTFSGVDVYLFEAHRGMQPRDDVAARPAFVRGGEGGGHEEAQMRDHGR